MYTCSLCVAGILFSPNEVGEHFVNVLKDGEHIPSSPFKLLVSEGNASKVKAWGQGLEEGTANELNEFTIDTKDAGQNYKIQPCNVIEIHNSPHCMHVAYRCAPLLHISQRSMCVCASVCWSLL